MEDTVVGGSPIIALLLFIAIVLHMERERKKRREESPNEIVKYEGSFQKE